MVSVVKLSHTLNRVLSVDSDCRVSLLRQLVAGTDGSITECTGDIDDDTASHWRTVNFDPTIERKHPHPLNPLTPTVTKWLHSIKHPVPDQVKLSFVIFDIMAL